MRSPLLRDMCLISFTSYGLPCSRPILQVFPLGADSRTGPMIGRFARCGWRWYMEAGRCCGCSHRDIDCLGSLLLLNIT
jgi:hypothetical protein